jgi:hypothetical protein
MYCYFSTNQRKFIDINKKKTIGKHKRKMIRTGQQEEKKKKKKQYIYIALFFAQSYQNILRQEPTCVREREREK